VLLKGNVTFGSDFMNILAVSSIKEKFNQENLNLRVPHKYDLTYDAGGALGTTHFLIPVLNFKTTALVTVSARKSFCPTTCHAGINAALAQVAGTVGGKLI
jgi:hypothetical protein